MLTFRFVMSTSDEDEIPLGSMTEWEREREQEEFARAAVLYRPLSFSMATRFTSALFSDDVETVDMPAEQTVRDTLASLD